MNENNNIENENSDRKPTVVVTGFGLFGNYKVNSSWECVKRLELKDINLIIDEIPVAYEEVDKRIENIWTKYKPILVVHCGVSSLAKCITIETRAVCHKNLYTKPDITGQLPNGMCASNLVSNDKTDLNDCIQCFESQINLQKVCNEVNQYFQKGLIKMPAVISSDAGRFLCEYIYRSSLEVSTRRTAFIHVPDITDNCSLEDIKPTLELTIQTIIKEVLETNKSNAE